jgi:hypothetical protein
MKNLKSPGVILGIIAVILAVAGTATAASLINGQNIQKGSIPLNRLSVGTQHLVAKAGQPGAAGSHGVPGATGAKGDQGAKGDKGDTGDAYLAGAYYAVAHYDVGDTNGGAIASVACSSQTDTAISGGVSVDDNTKNVPVGQSFPGRMDWSTNTPKSGRLDGWIVQFASQTSAAPEKVKVWALCVPGLDVPVTTTFTQSG